MPNMIETLEQEEIWYGQDGFPYRVDEMETSHIANVIGFLTRRAHNLYERRLWQERRLMENVPEEIFNEWLREQQNIISSNPDEWLKQRPLIQKLERVLRQRESIAPDMAQLGASDGQ
jgi:hypothetical protein